MRIFKVIVNFILLAAVFFINIILFPIINEGVHNFFTTLPNLMSPTGLLMLEKTIITYQGYSGFLIPASMTFFIWLVIYIMLFYFSVNQVIFLIRKKDLEKTVDSVSWWYALSSVINILWYVAWHSRLYLYTIFLIIALLFVLIVIYTRLHHSSIQFTIQEELFIKLPFSIYLGWISVTALLNMVYYTQSVHWHNFGLPDSTWTILLMAILALAAIFMLAAKHDYGYAAVILWTFTGILIKRYSDKIPRNDIILTAWIDIAAVVITAATVIIYSIKKYQDRLKKTKESVSE